MALTYSVIFGRLGRLMAHAEAARTYQGNLDTEYASTVAEYSGADMDQIGILSDGLERRKQDVNHLVSDLIAAANKTLIDLVDDNFTIVQKTKEQAIRELIRQMIADSQTIDQNTITVGTTSAGSSNVGDGAFLLSTVAPIVDRHGNRTGNLRLQNVKPETITSRCIIDQTAEGVDEMSERFRIDGQREVARMDQDWPTGSGSSNTATAVSPKVDGGRTVSKNIGTNSDFLHWTSNIPNHWVVDTGTAGTHILEGSTGFAGSNSVKFVGDGSTTPKIRQRLRVTAETLGQINPDRPYSIAFAAKYATTAPTVSLKVSIQNSSGTVLNNGAIGRAMETTVASGSLTTSFQLFTATVWSPTDIPKGSRIVVEFTGNIANTSEVYVTDLTVAEMKKLGRGLPYFQMIPGGTAFRLGDTFTKTISNNYAGTFAKEFDRFFDMQNMDLALPAAASGTISDGLVS